MTTDFQPVNSNYVRSVERAFNEQAFMHHIGASLQQIGPGYCEIHLPFLQELTQQHGLFHGGVVGTICDNAAGFAGYSLMGENEQPLSIEFKVNLIAKARGELLIAKGRVIRNGRRIKVCQTDVYCVQKDLEPVHCAIALVSVMALRDKLI